MVQWKMAIRGPPYAPTVTMDKIKPKDCQILSLGDSGFLQFSRVVSSDYGKPGLYLKGN